MSDSGLPVHSCQYLQVNRAIHIRIQGLTNARCRLIHQAHVLHALSSSYIHVVLGEYQAYRPICGKCETRCHERVLYGS